MGPDQGLLGPACANYRPPKMPCIGPSGFSVTGLSARIQASRVRCLCCCCCCCRGRRPDAIVLWCGMRRTGQTSDELVGCHWPLDKSLWKCCTVNKVKRLRCSRRSSCLPTNERGTCAQCLQHCKAGPCRRNSSAMAVPSTTSAGTNCILRRLPDPVGSRPLAQTLLMMPSAVQQVASESHRPFGCQYPYYEGSLGRR